MVSSNVGMAQSCIIGTCWLLLATAADTSHHFKLGYLLNMCQLSRFGSGGVEESASVCLSVCMSVCLSSFLSVSVSVCLFLSLTLSISTRLFLYFPLSLYYIYIIYIYIYNVYFYLSFYLFLSLPLSLSLSFFIYLYLSLSLCLPHFLSLSLSLSLSIYLSIYLPLSFSHPPKHQRTIKVMFFTLFPLIFVGRKSAFIKLERKTRQTVNLGSKKRCLGRRIDRWIDK